MPYWVLDTKVETGTTPYLVLLFNPGFHPTAGVTF